MTEQSDFLSFHNFFLIFFAAFHIRAVKVSQFYRFSIRLCSHLRWGRRKFNKMHLKLKKYFYNYFFKSPTFFLLFHTKLKLKLLSAETSEIFEMLLLQQLSEMWHNENFHIIDTFFRLPAFFRAYTRQSRGEQQRKKKNPSCARFVYCLACSCRRTEAEASEVDISEAKLSWVAGERERREKREIVMYISRTHSQRRLFLLPRRYLSFYIKEEEKLRSLRTSTERRMKNLLFALSPEWNE